MQVESRIPRNSWHPWLSKAKKVARKTEVTATYTCSTKWNRLQVRKHQIACACMLSHFSHGRLFARQAPLSTGLSRQEYWSGLHALLQGIFPTQGLIPGLLHCGQTLYCLSHQGSLRILEWVAYPSSRDLPDLELDWGLLQCKGILYQLSYRRSPKSCLQGYFFDNIKITSLGPKLNCKQSL